MSTKSKDYKLTTNGVDNSWNHFIEVEMSKKYFKTLQQKINFYDTIVYPPDSDTFNVFKLCPFESIKVVVIGQDPYINPGQGHGLSFSVQKGVTVPPSLVNIFKELESDTTLSFTRPNHGCLTNWAKQGVFLLNASLTVAAGNANSHSTYGWHVFTDAVIKEISDKTDGVVFMLWGAPAQKKKVLIDDTKHFIIESSHPSPLSYNRTSNPFKGSKCFSKCNEYLVSLDKEPIDWNL
jgi:uracil-DNA glycosylase